jgi:hypothetical protein
MSVHEGLPFRSARLTAPAMTPLSTTDVPKMTFMGQGDYAPGVSD